MSDEVRKEDGNLKKQLEKLAVDSTVVHKKFGKGTVVKINKNEKFIYVRFTVIVKTCSDSLFSIGQKNCQLFVAKLRNFLDSHNRMVLY